MLRQVKLLALLLTVPLGLHPQTSDLCRERTAIVNVLDPNGSPITNFTRDSFKASHRGKPLNVVWSQHRKDPGVRITVLLDLSSSMKADFEGGLAKWKTALAAALDFVSLAPPQVRLSFRPFASGAGQRFKTIGDRQSFEDWLNGPAVRDGKEVKGTTALYDAILMALKDFGTPEPGDAIYVVTDGGENASKEKMGKIERSLQSSGVRLFAFLLNGPMTSEESSTIRDLYDLTRRSGGFLVSVSREPPGSLFLHSYDFGERTVASIQASTRMLYAQIISYYMLGLQSQDNPSTPEAWKLDIVDAQGRRRKDVAMAYPQKLAPAACAAQSARR
jgi:hypothetical protein